MRLVVLYSFYQIPVYSEIVVVAIRLWLCVVVLTVELTQPVVLTSMHNMQVRDMQVEMQNALLHLICRARESVEIYYIRFWHRIRPPLVQTLDVIAELRS